jgi:hypothetical protein
MLSLIVALGLTSWSIGRLVTNKRVVGKVAMLEQHVSRRGRVTYTPKITYKVNEKVYTASYGWPFWFEEYKPGEPINILYSPSNPGSGYVNDFANLWGWVIVAFFVSGVFWFYVFAHPYMLRDCLARRPQGTATV